MKLLLILFFGLLLIPTSAFAEEVPNWFRNNASWFSNEEILDSEFTDALVYLIHEGVVVIESDLTPKTEQNIPDWIITILERRGQKVPCRIQVFLMELNLWQKTESLEMIFLNSPQFPM